MNPIIDFGTYFKELDEKIRLAAAMWDTAPHKEPDVVRARADEYITLINQQIKTLEQYTRYIKESTEKLLS